MRAIDINLRFHLPDEPRYGVNCTLAMAHDGVITPCNRQEIAPAFSAYRPSMDINNYYASLRLALHHRKRTFHPVQPQILG